MTGLDVSSERAGQYCGVVLGLGTIAAYSFFSFFFFTLKLCTNFDASRILSIMRVAEEGLDQVPLTIAITIFIVYRLAKR